MPMDIQSLLVLLLIGAIAGWLAGTLVKGYGFGLIGNIVVGVIGAFIGAWLLPQLGFGMAGLVRPDRLGYDRSDRAAAAHRPRPPRGLDAEPSFEDGRAAVARPFALGVGC